MKLTKETRTNVQNGDVLVMGPDRYEVRNMWASGPNGKGTSVTLGDLVHGGVIYGYPLSKMYGAEIIKRSLDKFNTEAFYTGGGIWLSAKYISDVTYIVVDSDDPLCLTYYDHRKEDADTDFPCQEMFRSVGIEEMNTTDMEYWKELAAELHRKAW